MLSCPDRVVGYKMSTLSGMPSPTRTIVYIDGFNSYYGAVKDTPYKVGIINPHPKRKRSSRLRGTFFKQIRTGALARSQLPPVVYDHKGPIHKPSGW